MYSMVWVPIQAWLLNMLSELEKAQPLLSSGEDIDHGKPSWLKLLKLAFSLQE